MFRHQGRRSPVLGLKIDRAVRLGVTALLGVAVAAACDSSSPFGGGGGGVENDPPTVAILVEPNPLGLDTIAAIEVSATDARGLDSIGYSVEDTENNNQVLETVWQNSDGALTDDLAATFDPAGLPPTTLRFIGLAIDNDTALAADTMEVELTDIRPPLVAIDSPFPGEQIPLFDTLTVRVSLLDDQAGLDIIEVGGYALRGDSAQATDSLVTRFTPEVRQYSTPWRTNTQVTFVLPPVNDTAETVFIIARASDAVGNTAADTIRIGTGGPYVAVTAPARDDSIRVGTSVPVEVAGYDRSGLTDLWLSTVTASDSTETRLCCAAVQYDTARITTTYTMPATAGDVRLVARARGAGTGLEARNEITIVAVDTPPPASDTVPPTASLGFAYNDRIEVTDTLTLVLSAKDPSGLDSMAVTLVGNNTATTETLVYDSVITYATPLNGTVRGTFKVDLREMYERIDALLPDTVMLPDTINFQAYGFAYQGTLCRAVAFGALDTETLTCGTQSINGTDHRIAAGGSQLGVDVLGVAGYTVRLPQGGVIADAVMDTIAERLFLSNYTNNWVEQLLLDANPDLIQFGDSIAVGSQPWGLFIDNSRDTLLVANSGGTNISLVDIAPATPLEVASERILTPNVVLYEIFTAGGDIEPLKITDIEFIDFSDRPQFVAQDSTGRIFYSTTPTLNAPRATTRVAIRETGNTTAGADATEIDHQFGFEFVDNESTWAVEGVDDLRTVGCTGADPADGDDWINVIGHTPGDTSAATGVFQTGCMDLDSVFDVFTTTLLARAAAANVDPRDYGYYTPVYSRGRWDLTKCCFQDTTYVVASGDGGVILTGDGDDSPAASEIYGFEAATGATTGRIPKEDLINNAAERITGLGLNQNGTMGVARGSLGAYFFTVFFDQAEPLRLQGVFTEGLGQGGVGAVLHPRHTDVKMSNDSTLAFVGARQSIKAIDTFHFNQRGDLQIRNTVVGPLRASLPLASDNAGLSCTPPLAASSPCVVVKLYGVTDDGGVVIVNVRRRDIQQ